MHFLQRFFQGRNGMDQLNMALAVLSIAASILGRFLFRSVFETLSYAFLFLFLFRMVSRNIPRRQQENALFLEKTKRFRRKSVRSGYRSGASYSKPPRVKKDRANYRYFKCPQCKQNLRAPRGKGKVKITCSGCNTVFYKTV